MTDYTARFHITNIIAKCGRHRRPVLPASAFSSRSARPSSKTQLAHPGKYREANSRKRAARLFSDERQMVRAILEQRKWEAIQAERDAGISVHATAEKYFVGADTIRNRTQSNKRVREARPAQTRQTRGPRRSIARLIEWGNKFGNRLQDRVREFV